MPELDHGRRTAPHGDALAPRRITPHYTAGPLVTINIDLPQEWPGGRHLEEMLIMACLRCGATMRRGGECPRCGAWCR